MTLSTKMHIAVVFLYLNVAFELVHSFENRTEFLPLSNAGIDITNEITNVLNSSDISNTVPDTSNELQTSAMSDMPNTETRYSDISTEVENTATNMPNTVQNLSNTATDSSMKTTYVSEKTSDVSSTTTLVSNEDYSILEGKHESLSTCPTFPLEPPDYKLLPNGSVWIEAYSLLLNDSHYIINNDILMFCIPFTKDAMVLEDHIINTSHLTLIGLGISMISLLLHLIVFSIVPDMRNLPGWNLAALCSSLFVSYFLIFIIGSGEAAKIPEMCVALAFLTHFFMLASIVWMTVMSYDVYVTLMRATGSLRMSSTQFRWKKFGIYCLSSFGIALLFAFSSLLAELLDIVPEPYRPMYREMCWFSKKTPLLIFFAGPVIILVCTNFVLFALSAYMIHSNKMKSGEQQDEHKSILKRRYLMYFRLSVIMGVTWIVGIVAAVFNEDWLWYLFVLLNTFQGFFIFLAFTCSKKVKKYFREKLFGERRGSQQTLSPTFQSYCFYANSIEKDLDKIVESSGKDKTDTIVIKL